MQGHLPSKYAPNSKGQNSSEPPRPALPRLCSLLTAFLGLYKLENSVTQRIPLGWHLLQVSPTSRRRLGRDLVSGMLSTTCFLWHCLLQMAPADTDCPVSQCSPQASQHRCQVHRASLPLTCWHKETPLLTAHPATSGAPISPENPPWPLLGSQASPSAAGPFLKTPATEGRDRTGWEPLEAMLRSQSQK